jgi:hypothetical protein
MSQVLTDRIDDLEEDKSELMQRMKGLVKENEDLKTQLLSFTDIAKSVSQMGWYEKEALSLRQAANKSGVSINPVSEGDMAEQDETCLMKLAGSGLALRSIEESVAGLQAEATETNKFGESWAQWQVGDGEDEEDVEGSSESDDSDEDFLADSSKLVPSTNSTKKGQRGRRQSSIMAFQQLDRNEERKKMHRGNRKGGGRGNVILEGDITGDGDGFDAGAENGSNSNKLHGKGGNRVRNTNPPVEVRVIE